jgi:hypothetical protein
VSWAKLLADQKVKHHKTSLAEINALRQVIERDLKDASLKGLSADRSFATAYNAALQTANMLIACSGYRLATIPGHHKAAFDATELVLGSSAKALVVYFDACRRKRNLLDYDRAHIASDTEAAELRVKAQEFVVLAEKWIAANHPALKKVG